MGTAVRADLLREVGGWRDYSWSEDWDVFSRCWLAGGTVVRVPDAVYRAHVHPASRNRAPDRAFRLAAFHRIRRANFRTWAERQHEPTASELLIWGIVAHLIADWPLQNDWMAKNKASLRHPAGYVHAGIHGALLALVFGWVAAPLAVAHLLIDTRKPVVWLSQLVRQTQPGPVAFVRDANGADGPLLVDVGLMVRFWTDQVWHIACIAVAALAVGA